MFLHDDLTYVPQEGLISFDNSTHSVFLNLGCHDGSEITIYSDAVSMNECSSGDFKIIPDVRPNHIIGSKYSDIIGGSKNSEKIDGGGGDDLLFGNGGSDIFVVNSNARVIIADFDVSSESKIDLTPWGVCINHLRNLHIHNVNGGVLLYPQKLPEILNASKEFSVNIESLYLAAVNAEDLKESMFIFSEKQEDSRCTFHSTGNVPLMFVVAVPLSFIAITFIVKVMAKPISGRYASWKSKV